MEKRQELLNRFVARITYNDDDGQVDIEMNKEAIKRYVESQKPDGTAEE